MSPDHVPPRARAFNAQPVLSQGRPRMVLDDPLGILEGQILLPPAAYLVLSLLDGINTLEEVRRTCQEILGQPVTMAVVADLVRRFDDQALLDSPSFQAALSRARAAFAAQEVRPASQAGLAYPAEPQELITFLDQLLALAPARPRPGLGGLVAPHIDFRRGAQVYASAYQALPRDKDRLCLLLGTAHAETREKYVILDKDMATPLGRARTDRSVAKRLAALDEGRFTFDGLVHRREHSLEFQVLLLQRLLGPEVRIVPVLCGHLDTAGRGLDRPGLDKGEEEFLATLGEVVRSEGALVVVGADLAHVGPQFGDLEPVSLAQLADLRLADLGLLIRAARQDAAGFFQAVAAEGDRRRICGLAPLYAALRILPPGQGLILDYGQWRDEEGHGSVTFAALAWGTI